MTDKPDASAQAARYTLPAILFHWTSFALVVFVGVLGLLFGSIPRPNRLFWINIHAVVGLAVLALAVARLFWRMRSPPPAYPEGVSAITRRLSQPVPVYEAAEELHEMLAYSLFGLAGLHGLAALWHHFVQKDGILQRMWPFGKA